MHGVGRTVFSGNRIEEFQVEMLGVLENIGPKESLILARLSGGPLEQTGVMQGMSGSPVYIDGKLVGAVAMAFPFSKDPIAGIRPIEDMLRPICHLPRQLRARNGPALARTRPHARCSRPEPAGAGERRMIDIATPISLRRVHRATLEAFAPHFARSAWSRGRASPPADDRTHGQPADLNPGSMISVQLMAGE